MKSITEKIRTVNERNSSWAVTDTLLRSHEIAEFSAPDSDYIWIYKEGGMIGFLSLRDILMSFSDFMEEEEHVDLKKTLTSLKPGESWSEDGMNIYVRV